MFVRSTVIDADPARVEEGIRFVRDRVLPLVSELEGNLGLLMLANRATGRTVTSTFWGGAAALEASGRLITSIREEAGASWPAGRLRRSGRSPSCTGYAGPEPAFASRTTRLEFDRGDAEHLVDTYRTTTVPALSLLEGFASAGLLLDLDGGRAVSVVTFEDWRALETSRRPAAEIRRTSEEKAHARATEIVEADVVVADLRMPEEAS